MKFISAITLSLIAVYYIAGCASVDRSLLSAAGEYRAVDDKSRIVLDDDGTYVVENLNQELPLELQVLGGSWTKEHDQVTLSWTDLSKEKLQSIRSIVYTFSVEDSGVVLQLTEGQHLPLEMLQNPMGVQICKKYRREPNKTPQTTTGSSAPDRV